MPKITPISKAKGRKAVAANTGGGGADWFKVEPNTNYDVRIMPGMGGEPFPWTPHYFHQKSTGGKFDMFEVDGKWRNITCPVAQFNEPACPICQVQEYLEEEGSSESGLKCRVTFLMNVIVDGQVMLWNAPPSVQKKLVEIWNSPKYGPETFYPDTGRNFEVSREKEASGFWKYNILPDPNASEIEDLEKVLNQCSDLNKLIVRYDYDTILALVKDQLDDVVPVDEIFGKAAMKKVTKSPTKKTSKKKVAKKTSKKKATRKKKA